MCKNKAYIKWHHGKITREDREKLIGQHAFVLWFTGLPASGKSTLANATEEILFNEGHYTWILDGDNIRHGLSRELGFSEKDRTENIRRVCEVAKMFCECGIITLTALTSPFAKDRNMAREILKDFDFIEIYLECSLRCCEERDSKEVYSKANAGIIECFTGVSDPYEVPEQPEIKLNTEKFTIEECLDKINNYLINKAYLKNS